MKFDITKRIEAVDRAIDRTENAFHKAILENYRRHSMLEVCGYWQEILSPQMTAPHPTYRIHESDGRIVTADGMVEVEALYRRFAAAATSVIYHTEESVFVNDDGCVGKYINHRFFPGVELTRKIGVQVDDPEATYLLSSSIITFFSYDMEARLTGEYVYHGHDRSIVKCAPEEVITIEECREKLTPLIKSMDEIRFSRRPVGQSA